MNNILYMKTRKPCNQQPEKLSAWYLIAAILISWLVLGWMVYGIYSFVMGNP